ncbi:MAG: hypothetical protein AB1714_06235 [Acidobacteriota bacterium]
MKTYLLGVLLAFLPRRWRASLAGDVPIHWGRAALTSGFLEMLVAFALLAAWYFATIHSAVDQQLDAAMTAAETTGNVPGRGGQIIIGFTAWAYFAVHPLTWLLGYLVCEGLVRTLAAAITEEQPACLFLVVIDRVVEKTRRSLYEARVPLVRDQVIVPANERSSWDLKVLSCRSKPDWKHPLTISYEGEGYKVVADAPGTDARPHGYLLKRPAAGEAFRGFQAYHPEDILLTSDDRASFLVSLFRWYLNLLRKRDEAPLGDVITRGPDGDDSMVLVESLRPKPEWMHARTIEFEERLYRVETAYNATRPRPFGYRLRLLPPGEAARGLIRYSPDLDGER